MFSKSSLALTVTILVCVIEVYTDGTSIMTYIRIMKKMLKFFCLSTYNEVLKN